MKKLISFILTLGFLVAPTALAGVSTGELTVSQTDMRSIRCARNEDNKMVKGMAVKADSPTRQTAKGRK